MVDDFMVCVDRVITSACFEAGTAAVAGGGGGYEGRRGTGVGGCAAPAVGREGGRGEDGFLEKVEGHKKKSSKKGEKVGGGEMIECRICQEEGEEGDMEAPCACTGTIKFAHRKCIQRWCNKKGDIICEICNQAYAPNYSIPPSRAIQDCLTIDIRQGWGPQIELSDPHFLAIAAAQQQLLQAEYEDFSGANSSGIMCCRSLALMLMLLLLVRHALLITGQSATLQDASAFSNVSLLQLVGFVLPVYIISRSCYSFLCRRRRQH